MRMEILNEMSKDELIEYCVALNDCLYIMDKVSELRNDINRAQIIIAGYNDSLRDRLVEQTSAVNRLEAMEVDLNDTYRGNIKPAKVKPYRQSEKLDVEVMDLNDDPETDKKPEPKYNVNDIVSVADLEGVFKICYCSDTRPKDLYYDIQSIDHQYKYIPLVSESRITKIDKISD